MKQKIIVFAIAITALSFHACKDAETESITTSDQSTTSSTNESTNASTSGSTSANDNHTAQSTSNFDENASYVDLETGKKVKAKRDASTGYITDFETNEPLSFYYNPVTRDTFDRSGRVVNNYLIKGIDGSYKVDEERWRVKMDKDGDMKAKDGDEAKIKVDGNEEEVKIKTDDSKVKMDENSYKKKENGKVVEKSKH